MQKAHFYVLLLLALAGLQIFGSRARAAEVTAKDVNIILSELSRDEKVQMAFLNNYYTEFATIINQVQLLDTVKSGGYTLSGTLVSEKCISFMNKDQLLGTWGMNIARFIINNSRSFPLLLQGGQISKTCPRYNELNTAQKSAVIVLILTAIAHFESSCKPVAKTKGPNGIAYGLFQLHKGKEQFYDSNRQFCERNSSSNPILASQCAISMLERQLEKNNGVLFSNKSYWDVLRPNGRAKKADDIQNALKRSSLCQQAYL